jgi:hypothetical protein
MNNKKELLTSFSGGTLWKNNHLQDQEGDGKITFGLTEVGCGK